MVINGRPEAWYDKVSVASLSPYTVFFGGGEHYAYRATHGDILKDKDKSCIVIDGKPGEFFEFIDTRKTHCSRAHFSWTYLVRLGDKGYCVSDGQKAVLGGGYEVLVSALALNGHSLVSPSSEFVCLNRVA